MNQRVLKERMDDGGPSKGILRAEVDGEKGWSTLKKRDGVKE